MLIERIRGRIRRVAGLTLLVLQACVPGVKATAGPTPEGEEPPPERPAADSSATPQDTLKPTPNPQPVQRAPAVPATLALARGWMPLAATGIPAFLARHPQWDGRGVLIAILDSGIDPGAPGLDSTTTGRPKLLDLRNFSSEGRVELVPVAPSRDSVGLGGRRLAGMSRVRGLAATGPWFIGALQERTLGDPPAADLNDNGTDADTLLVVVTRASDGWVLFADTDGDGSLSNESPIHDYLGARETFGWHRPGAAAPLRLAVNFSEARPAGAGTAMPPLLDLVFDTEAHGTHVAGIAAGHRLGGIAGFDGAAPGAQLLGLKISRNDFGGLTTTGSVVAALDYAIRFAAARSLPLVVNMSFGVGNEREGAARLDRLLDSMLTAHPEVVFVTSAGNDGPGLSTVGFPGSMRRAITVGATQPAAFFLPPGVARPRTDPLLFFSSRGGELAKPDVVAPGTAYSSVPGWNVGEEFKSGTSMASPHIAGVVALLLSGLAEQHRAASSETMRRALAASARVPAGQTGVDAGAGLPEVEAAWQVLQGTSPLGEFEVEFADRPGLSAGFALSARADTALRFRIRRLSGKEPVPVLLSSSASWLAAPASLTLDSAETLVTLLQRPPDQPGVYSGTVTATAPGVSGPLFRMVSTIVVPEARSPVPIRVGEKLSPGAERRVVFAADSGRPFRVRMATAGRGETLIAALHQPGGAPIFGDNGIPGGPDSAAAIFDVDGRDARAGLYEAVAVAPPGTAAAVTIAVDHAPVGLRLEGARDSLRVTAAALADSAVVGRLRFGLLGGEQRMTVSGEGGADVRVPVAMPAWARQLVVDLELDPEVWPDFTDFGLTALDAGGRILDKSPANYAHSRLSVALPHPLPANAMIMLSPGFAEPGSRERWSGRLTIRLQADGPVALAAREGDEFQLQRRGTMAFHAALGEVPWQLPAGYQPLGLFLVESAGLTWTWELPLGSSPTARP